MLLATTIDLPKDKGRIALQKKFNSTYVLFTVSRVYDPVGRRSNPKRVTIGKVCPDDPTKMIPNEKFASFYPHVDLGIKVQPTNALAANQENNARIEPPPYRYDSLCIGPYVLINSVINDYNLKDCLVDAFGDASTALTLDLASFMIVTEGNQAIHYQKYARAHALFTKDMHIYSDSTISRHFRRISEEGVRTFLRSWNECVSKEDFINISYDSTNKNSQAGDIELVGFGEPKVDIGSPTINVAVAYDQTNERPMFYETYPGAIPDVSQLRFAITLAAEYGYKFLRFIIDRGYFSRENIEYIDANGYEFVMMVKGDNTIVAPHIEPLLGTFEKKLANRINGDLFGITIKREFCGRTRYFHVYHCISSASSSSQDFLNEVDREKIALTKNIGREYAPSAQQQNYFDLTFTSYGVLISFTLKEDAVQQKLQLFGYFSIITSEELTAAEAYDLYKSRDVSEKLFCSSKTFIGSHCFRVHSNQALYGKMFIEFVALIIRNRIYVLLRTAMIKLGKRYEYMNVPAALDELDGIKITKGATEQYRFKYHLTKAQKDVLAPFGISQRDVQKIADDLSKKLATLDSDEELHNKLEQEINATFDDDVDVDMEYGYGEI